MLILKLLLVLIAFQIKSGHATAGCIVSLGGSEWRFVNRNKTVQTTATIPGDIYTALHHSGQIGDPLYGRNDIMTRWVALDNWTLSHTFSFPACTRNRSEVLLVTQGVDTTARVLLNEHLLGTTNNMFKRLTWSIKQYLREGSNVLAFEFESPVATASALARGLPYRIPPNCWPADYHGECHVNLLRKMQSSFAWDWGPALPMVGIWSNVFIEAYDRGKIENIKFFPACNSNCSLWSANVSIVLTVSKDTHACLIVTIYELKAIKKICQILKQPSDSVTLDIISMSDGVKAWWPNGHGDPYLYTLHVTYAEDSTSGKIWDSKEIQVGFRTVELAQDLVRHNQGLTYYLRINRIPVFIRGSNYVPASLLSGTQTRDRLEFLLSSARDANMNMLRVWGGGKYESDIFYELADKMGIMIWQDMMFACAMYPSTKEFLNNVQTEVEQNVKRLQHHPSVVLWSGNNENEAAIAEGWYNTKAHDPVYSRDYRRLYLDLIKPLVEREDPSRPYVPSSPSNGAESLSEGGLAENPQDNRYGDVHFYVYNGSLWDSSVYPVTRFTSEFGFQSLPGLDAWKTATNNSVEWRADGPLMQFREHHPNGLPEMFSVSAAYMTSPIPSNSPSLNYTRFAYWTQINQAMAYKAHVGHLRRHQCTLSPAGEGLTMGAMFWQLNDVWAAPTWSSIDHLGNWKMAHYFARRFYAPSWLSVHYSERTDIVEGHVMFYSSPSGLTSVTETVRVRCFKFDSFISTAEWQFSVQSNTSCPVVEAFRTNVTSLLHRCHCPSRNNCLIVFEPTNNQITGDWLIVTRPKYIKWPRSANVMEISVRKEARNFIVTLTSKSPNLFVWLIASGVPGWFSDNGFPVTESSTQVKFIPWKENDFNLTTFKKSLTVLSMASIYSI